eukprot:800603-Prorocentrum_minimum.AAC.1
MLHCAVTVLLHCVLCAVLSVTALRFAVPCHAALCCHCTALRCYCTALCAVCCVLCAVLSATALRCAVPCCAVRCCTVTAPICDQTATRLRLDCDCPVRCDATLVGALWRLPLIVRCSTVLYCTIRYGTVPYCTAAALESAGTSPASACGSRRPGRTCT